MDVLISDLYGIFCRSSKQIQHLHFWENALDLGEYNLLNVHAVRWLSREAAIVRLVKVLPAVLQVLANETRADHKDSSEALRHKLLTYDNLVLLHFSAHILKFLGDFTRYLQKGGLLAPFEIEEQLQITINSINAAFVGGLMSDIVASFYEELVEISNYVYWRPKSTEAIGEEFLLCRLSELDELRNKFEGIMSQAALKVVESLENRFKDVRGLMAATKLFDPKQWPKPANKEGLKLWGKRGNAAVASESFIWRETLLKHFGQDKELNGVVFKAPIDSEQFNYEWTKFVFFFTTQCSRLVNYTIIVLTRIDITV